MAYIIKATPAGSTHKACWFTNKCSDDREIPSKAQGQTWSLLDMWGMALTIV